MPTETQWRNNLFTLQMKEIIICYRQDRKFHKSEQIVLSPVMPITLSLKVYGNNNFLSYGDFFTELFTKTLPRVSLVFQIVGVDHTIDTSGWSTNYTTLL